MPRSLIQRGSSKAFPATLPTTNQDDPKREITLNQAALEQIAEAVALADCLAHIPRQPRRRAHEGGLGRYSTSSRSDGGRFCLGLTCQSPSLSSIGKKSKGLSFAGPPRESGGRKTNLIAAWHLETMAILWSAADMTAVRGETAGNCDIFALISDAATRPWRPVRGFYGPAIHYFTCPEAVRQSHRPP